MQTFLPYASFQMTANCLDRMRLGKQRVETLQILRTIYYERKGWAKHPAVQMWRGHERVLGSYGEAICREWKRRGYKDNTMPKITDLKNQFFYVEYPWWFGDERLHNSHRAALLAKNPQWYVRFLWNNNPEINYFWPTKALTEAA